MKKQTFLFVLFPLLVLACKRQNSEKANHSTETTNNLTYQKFQGKTMGTTYHITFAGSETERHRRAIDSILLRINQEVSTYIGSAIISQFNQSERGVAVNVKQHAHFLRNYKAALSVFKETKGLFDPTVMPLVNYWGFGYTGKEKIKAVDREKVHELLQYVGMAHVRLTDSSFLSKDLPDVQLDFSALAKGYGVDQICHYFNLQGALHYFVEIGGEVNAKGKNPTGDLWTVGISRPEREANPIDFFLTIELDNKAIATSGNYRNVYEVDGVHYFHTIDPRSGFPKRDRLLSASVITDDCMMADAYATAFMVMGLDTAMAFAKDRPELGICLIYSDEEGELRYFNSENVKVNIFQ